jgi:hypothetical protein
MIFKVVKCSLIEIVIGLSVVLSFYKEKWKFKIHEKW